MNAGLSELKVPDPEFRIDDDGLASKVSGVGKVARGERDLRGQCTVHGAEGIDFSSAADGGDGLFVTTGVR